ncbi:MAG: hypothetical protein ACF788_04235 [Novipirellula sp. JB048]
MRMRKGFVLVMVVVLLAVVSLILARVATVSLRVAGSAVSAEQELRERWAATSIRCAALEEVRGRFSSHGGEAGEEPFLWKDVRLAGKVWRVLLADESAKLPLPAIATRRGELLPMVEREFGLGRWGVRLSDRAAERGAASRMRLDEWLEGSREPGRLALASQSWTLWGNGRLNLRTARDETVELLFEVVLGIDPPRDFHQLRRSALFAPEASGVGGDVPAVSGGRANDVTALLVAADLRESQISRLERWVDLDGECESVWVFCQDDASVPATFFVRHGHGARMSQWGYVYP